MKEKLFFINLIIFNFFIFSCSANKIILTEKLLSEKGIQSINLNEKSMQLQVIVDQKILMVNNVIRVVKSDNYWCAFLSLEKEAQAELFLVYNNKLDKYDYFRFYKESSYLFEDEGVCFSIHINPHQYPLPKYYEITYTVFDCNSFIKKECHDSSINWYMNDTNRTYQDFYYKKPVFKKGYSSDDSLYFIRNYMPKNESILYVQWEQAHFPLGVTLYFLKTGKLYQSNGYPEIGNSQQYRTEEFIPLENQLPNIDRYKSSKKKCYCAVEKNNTSVAVLYDYDNKIDYNNCEIVITKNRKTSKVNLADVFIFQDEFKDIQIVDIFDSSIGFIISTKVFSYDLYIDLDTFVSDCYLRASSYSNEQRNLE